MPTAISPTSITLRPYQQHDLDATRAAIRRGVKKICYVLPTGGGKTTVASFMIAGAVAKGLRVMWFAHRRELIMQPSARLDEMGIDHGIIMASHPRYDVSKPVQVASIDTAVRRELPPVDIVIVDEAHHARSDSYTEVLKKLDSPIVVGITATPCRLDGRGLGDIFDELIIGPSVASLMEQGYLVPAMTYSWRVDTRGLRVTAGDFNQKQANDKMSDAKLVGNVVEHWFKRCRGRQTIVFASGIGHSKLLRDRFAAAGVRVEHLDGNTPTEERDAMIRRLRAGDLDIITNYGVLTEGTDIPNVSAIINCRLTQSESLWLQMAGRGLRSHSGKTDCIIHDHAGCALLHGLPEQPREWTLTRTATAGKKAKQVNLPVDDIRVCPDCGRVLEKSAAVCPCGYAFKTAEIRESAEELELVKNFKADPPSTRRNRFFRWMWEQENFKRKDGLPYSPGYAYAKYKAQYGVPPLNAWRSEYQAEKRSKLTRPATTSIPNQLELSHA